MSAAKIPVKTHRHELTDVEIEYSQFLIEWKERLQIAHKSLHEAMKSGSEALAKLRSARAETREREKEVEKILGEINEKLPLFPDP